jgi:hypothetical protein
LPAAFIAPNFEFLFLGIYALGLTEGCVAYLTEPTAADSVTVIAVATLVVVALASAAGLMQLLSFHRHHRAATWSQATRAVKACEVADPLMRLVSKCRVFCLGRRFHAAPVHRTVGSYEKGDVDASEPARTERLLAQHHSLARLALAKRSAGDSYDALSLFWLSRTSGSDLMGTLFTFVLCAPPAMTHPCSLAVTC